MGVNWERPRNLDEMRAGYSHERARWRMIALLIASVCVVLVVAGVWLMLPTEQDASPILAANQPVAPVIEQLPEQPAIQRPVPVALEVVEARDPAPVKPETPPQAAIQQPVIAPQEQQDLLARVGVMIRQGDIAGARVILARLDRAGNRQATFTLAETYDPALLAQWNVRGIRPDPDKAASLYQRTADGGVGAARERMNALATPTQR